MTIMLQAGMVADRTAHLARLFAVIVAPTRNDIRKVAAKGMWHHRVGRTWLQAEALLKHFVAPALNARYRQVFFIASVMAKVSRKWNFPVQQAPLAANVKDATRPTQLQEISLKSK